jgi:hypothetical protein
MNQTSCVSRSVVKPIVALATNVVSPSPFTSLILAGFETKNQVLRRKMLRQLYKGSMIVQQKPELSSSLLMRLHAQSSTLDTRPGGAQHLFSILSTS